MPLVETATGIRYRNADEMIAALKARGESLTAKEELEIRKIDGMGRATARRVDADGTQEVT